MTVQGAVILRVLARGDRGAAVHRGVETGSSSSRNTNQDQPRAETGAYLGGRAVSVWLHKVLQNTEMTRL